MSIAEKLKTIHSQLEALQAEVNDLSMHTSGKRKILNSIDTVRLSVDKNTRSLLLKERPICKAAEVKENTTISSVESAGGVEDRNFVKCNICSALLLEKNLAKHKAKGHPKKKKQSISATKNGEKKLRLTSKRGTMIKGELPCSECKKIITNPTRYAISNKGSVILCVSCKSSAKLRASPKKKQDAMDYAITGGGFESSRRKH